MNYIKIIKRKIYLLMRFSKKGRLLFDKDYRRISKKTRNRLNKLYKLHTKSLVEILRVKDELIKEVEEGKDKDFNTATLLLLSRSVQHIESIYILVERGLYGDAFPLIRCLLSDMNMFYYLHFKPQLLKDFLDEKQESYQIDKKFKQLFKEAAIDFELEKQGIKSITPAFQTLSKAAHASAWGTQLFGTQNLSEKNKYCPRFGPQMEFQKTLGLLNSVLSAHWDYLNMILWHRYHNGLDIESDFWLDIRKRVKSIKPRLVTLSMISTEFLAELDQELENSSDTSNS